MNITTYTETIEAICYLVIDNNGNKYTTVTEDLSTTIMVFGLDTPYCFEAESRHLKSWAEDQGFQYFETPVTMQVPFFKVTLSPTLETNEA